MKNVWERSYSHPPFQLFINVYEKQELLTKDTFGVCSQ